MSEPTAVLVPQMNPNDDRAVLVAWRAPAGSWIEAQQPLATLETTKATFDVESPCAGYLAYSAAEKTLLEVGAAFAWLYSEQPQSQPPSASLPRRGAAADESGSDSLEAVGFTRKALRLMRELGLSQTDFDTRQRVDVAEVERVARARDGAGDPGAGKATAAAPAKQPLKQRLGERLLEQSPSKMIEAATLTDTYRVVVPSMVTIACDSERLKTRLQAVSAACGPVSLLELVIFEAARLLREFPELNGFFADGGAHAYTSVHMGFAVNNGRSLKVPVVREADTLEQREVAKSVRNLMLQYMRNELQASDLIGGTCTVTDLSQHEVIHFIPVLNARQSAILGLCAPRKSTHEQNLVLTFDHRISDGMQAASFLKRLRAQLENQGNA